MVDLDSTSVVCRRPDKTAYPSRRLARQACRRIADGGRPALTAYRCAGTSHWHVGNSSADERAKIREIG